ncbi:helix-turn-helix domain-containing protein [Staphylococcus haemolyticus]|uniref:helix-turn-helix domain-containing protein n=2 Tax=Staphylococcus haemolyticus TaxID=1283 RepID=UPI000A10EE99|nr:helix-turn-helix transcriptional regulator [Staphylococcus haemolyticus]MBY6180496.1 helix-turn-helix transcriptional regulator [Staphylococcaceae bacterium DP2N0-1]MCC2086568.1 helix-turn-helix transcriptional regulator [Staphylococcus haemolyticus]
MNFGEVLNKYREELSLSVNKLGELADVSPTYISRIQNNSEKVPSKKVTFKLMKVLFLQSVEKEWEEINVLDDFIIAYLFKGIKNHSELNKDELEDYRKLLEEFFEFLKTTSDKEITELYNMSNKIYENKIIMKDDLSFDTTDDKEKLTKYLLDKPIFDLEWYLTQNEFEILAPRNIITKNDYTDIDYNVITEKDKEIICNLVFAFLTTKYKKTYKKNSKEFFRKIFENSIQPLNNK